MLSILNNFNPFKGSKPEDKQVIKDDYTEDFEEISAKELTGINTEVFEKIFDEEISAEEFTGINTKTEIPEFNYALSMLEVTYNTIRKYSLLSGKYTGEYLPWALKTTSSAMDYVANASGAANMVSYILPSVTIPNCSAIGYKAKLIQGVCDITYNLGQPFFNEINHSCSHKIIEDAIRTQGDYQDDYIYGVFSKMYKSVEYQTHEITSQEIDEAEIYTGPDTNIENINATQPGNSPRCVF